MSRTLRCLSLLAALAIIANCQAPAFAQSRKQAAKHPAQKRLMVPPPPPEIPLLNGASTDEHLLSTLGVPLDYMSAADLLSMQRRLQETLEKLQKEKADQDQSLAEQKDRAAKFEELYKEGVVSRRELEHAKREFAQSQDEAPDLSRRLEDVKTDLARVRKQLDVVNKRQAKKEAASGAKHKSVASHKPAHSLAAAKSESPPVPQSPTGSKSKKIAND